VCLAQNDWRTFIPSLIYRMKRCSGGTDYQVHGSTAEQVQDRYGGSGDVKVVKTFFDNLLGILR
jgi:hypothetical protein